MDGGAYPGAFVYEIMRQRPGRTWWSSVVSPDNPGRVTRPGVRKLLKRMAGSTRLELATSGVTGRRSNQLNYDPAS